MLHSHLFQGYKDCPNWVITNPTMIGGTKNILFLDALKHSVLELFLFENTLKEMKTVFIKILITKCISKLFILDTEIVMPNSALHYENLPALAPAFCRLWFTLLQILYCLNYQGKTCTLSLRIGEKVWGSQVFGQGKHIQIKGK